MQVSTTDSEVAQAASFAAEQLSSQSISLSPFEVKEVLSARSKVAAGKVFELKLKLSQGNLPEQIVQASPHVLSNKEKVINAMLTGMAYERLPSDPSLCFAFTWVGSLSNIDGKHW